MERLLKLIVAVVFLCFPLFVIADDDEFYYYNPVHKTTLPDPTVIRADDGCFYLSASDNDKVTPIFRSSDLVSWHFMRPAFTDLTRPDFVPNGGVWAPDINYINGQYVLYYCMSLWGGIQSCGVGVAVSDKAGGPYRDLGKIFTSGEIGVQNSIDQFYFEDTDGSKWLFWGSFRGIYAVELSDDGLSVKEGAVKRRVAGSLTEGTCVYKRGGYYYMIGSTGSCCVGEKSTYHLMVSRSENLLGPYLDKDGLPALSDHFSMLLHGSECVIGPGHCSEVVEDDEGQTWLMYHGYQADNIKAARVLYMDQVQWDSDGWPYIVGEKPSVCWTKPALPARKFTYSRADYIEFDGDVDSKCMFDTGYVPKENTRIEVRCRSYSRNRDGAETTGRWRAVFSSGASKSDGYSLYSYSKEFTVFSDKEFWTYYGGGFVDETIVPQEYGIDYTFSASRFSLTVNGVTYPADHSAYAETTQRLTLFCGNKGNTFCGRIYSLRVYEGDALVHNYEPCVRNEDGMAMFHDTVTDTYVHPSDPRVFSYGNY